LGAGLFAADFVTDFVAAFEERAHFFSPETKPMPLAIWAGVEDQGPFQQSRLPLRNVDHIPQGLQQSSLYA
jgi:hypothetical protein